MIAPVIDSPAPAAELLALLRCPATGAELEPAPHSLRTSDGARSYPVVGGVPILIDRERSLFDPADYLAAPSPPARASLTDALKGAARWIRDLPPGLSRNIAGEPTLRRLVGLLRERPETGARPRVLVVGGAAVGVGLEAVLGAGDLEVIGSDVSLTANVSVVCDGHDLPFRDGVFDAVVCQAVLEHVLDPQRVADEIWRVLAPGGLIYSEVPFMAQVHAGAFDFTRFSHLGHRRLWRRFDEIESGIDSGPGMALGWSILYCVRALTPRSLWPAAERLVSLLFFWLKYLDPWVAAKPAALDAAFGTFFLGHRRESALDDRAIVRGYRGADGPAPTL